MYKDTKIFESIKKEKERQINNIELIASENFVSKEVLAAQGSILTNKYAEGYPNKRYYGGCEFVDEIEIEAQERLKNYSMLNMLMFNHILDLKRIWRLIWPLIKTGDKILGMSLSEGGHLTHGHKLSFFWENFTELRSTQ